MEASDVVTLVTAFDEIGVVWWLDGGWGVDCLLGEQTREHRDPDLVVGRGDVDRVMDYLERQGYGVVRNWLPTAVALRDRAGREVDLHPVDLTADGGGDQVLQDGSTWHYSPPVEGAIAGRAARCASPGDQVLMHLGYDPRPVDFVMFVASLSASTCLSSAVRHRDRQRCITPDPPLLVRRDT